MGETVEGIAAGVQQIRDAGKDMTGFQVQGPLRYVRDDKRIDLARSMESVPELVAAGATDIHVTLQAFSRDPADAPKLFQDFVARFQAAI